MAEEPWQRTVARGERATHEDERLECGVELRGTEAKSLRQGRWSNEHKHAAAAILDKQTYYLDVEDTYRGIRDVDLVPNLSPQDMAAIELGKDFMLSHGYIERDFEVQRWAAPEFLEAAAKEHLEESWRKTTHEKLPRPTPLRLG